MNKCKLLNYIYQSVESLILPNTLINLSTINHQLIYQLSVIFIRRNIHLLFLSMLMTTLPNSLFMFFVLHTPFYSIVNLLIQIKTFKILNIINS